MHWRLIYEKVGLHKIFDFVNEQFEIENILD